MLQISLQLATEQDVSIIVAIDYALDSKEHIELRREEKIKKAISKKECYIIKEDRIVVGFIIFDYSFFDHGWIDLLVIDEKYRGKGIGGEAIKLICKDSKTNKVFTSTNNSNLQMQKVLTKVGFTYAGQVEGLDEGDPELFYYKKEDTTF